MPKLCVDLIFRLFALKRKDFCHRLSEDSFRQNGFFKKTENSSKLRLTEMRYLNQEKMPKYFFEIYVTPTSSEAGSGHISMSIIEKRNGTPKVVEHMSYVPMATMSLINGVTLGTIPVLSRNYHDIREDDLAKAKMIYRIPVSKESFLKGLEEHKRIKEGVEQGSHLYGVTGTANILSLFLTTLWGYYLTSNQAIKKFKLCRGVLPSEDHLGFVVTDLDEIPEKPIEAKLFNCTQAVASILEKTGFPVTKGDVLPVSLAQELSKLPGVIPVQESLIPGQDGRPSESELMGRIPV